MLPMTIAGADATGDRAIEIINPATGRSFATCALGGEEHVERAVRAAAAAQPAWAADLEGRRAALRRAAAILAAAADQLGRLVTLEQGKPLRAAVKEIRDSARWLGETATLPLAATMFDEEGAELTVAPRPYGVVAVLSPWNFPVLCAVFQLAPALLAGNTVVWKPSPTTPLCALRVGELLREALPPGVLNVITGGAEIAQALVRHPTVRKVALTGSVETGRAAAQLAAGLLKPMSLELGGNDAAIVLADVDVERVAPMLVRSAFYNLGQACTAIKRLYVQEARFDQLVEAMARIARQARIGDGLDPEVDYGPVTTAAQLERIDALVADAAGHGATIHSGGSRTGGGGNFYPLTIVTDIAEGRPLVDEEQFGPALPVMRFAAVEEAIARANDTPYGIGGSVWTADRDRGLRLASQLACGTTWVNLHGPTTPRAPFGGWKLSGMGLQNGRWGLRAWSQVQVVGIEAA